MIYSTTGVGSPSEATHADIAIVGAGPRGTSVLERLCASAPNFIAPGARLRVHVIDPAPPGAGFVWRTDQSPELLMNTVAAQITMFTDDSMICSGPVRPGPSLYDWSKKTNLGLGPDDYATRAQYGQYLEWVFADVVRQAPPGVDVEVHAALAVRLDDAADGLQTLTLSNGRTLAGLAAVLLAQGHLPVLPDKEQQQLAAYAKRRNLRHFPPANPADVDLSSIAPGEPVLLRGLGLNFFDYMTLLTTGRGGSYTRTSEGLRYHSSGNEPCIYASSRRGIPYQARGDNEKSPHERHFPLLLTDEVIYNFRKRANTREAPDFITEVWPLVSKEIQTVYYKAILGQARSEELNFQARFLAIPVDSPEEIQFLNEVGIPETNYWSWERIYRPQGEHTFATTADWKDWMINYLREDAAQARLGNISGPLKAALDVMRDLRNELRLIVDHGGLSGISRREHLDAWYTPINAFLSIGPPRLRIEQMLALVEAGVLDVVGPRVEVREEDDAWLTHSPEIPGSAVRVTALIEARLPEPNLRNTRDDLLSYLLKTGQCRPHTLNGYETGGLDVTPSPFRLIDSQGHAHARRFAIGVPTEGVHWVTAAGARPGVNSVTLSDADAAARGVLHAAMIEIERGSYMATLEVKAYRMAKVEVTTLVA